MKTAMASYSVRKGVRWHMAAPIQKIGRPTKFGRKMPRTSLTLPQELMDQLEEARKMSEFQSIADQIRYELMFPRGMWKEAKRYLPPRPPEFSK
jgi:hypothetical protein